MFEYYTFGTQVHASGIEGANQDTHLSPLDPPPEPTDRTHTQAASNPPDASHSTNPNAGTSLSAPFLPQCQPIENLVQKLSKQSLIPEVSRELLQQTHSPTQSLDSTTSIVTNPLPVLNPFPPLLEVDEDEDDSFMDIVPQQVQAPVMDYKRSRRLQDCKFNNNPTNLRAIETLVDSMISTRSQCTVRPPPSTLTPVSVSGVQDSNMEPECNLSRPLDDLSCRTLEVDDSFCDDDETLLLLEAGLDNWRQSGAPASMRHCGLLRYRGSAETALRCQNVVRNRPRMRKRKGPKSSKDPKPTLPPCA